MLKRVTNRRVRKRTQEVKPKQSCGAPSGESKSNSRGAVAITPGFQSIEHSAVAKGKLSRQNQPSLPTNNPPNTITSHAHSA
jgi:hypothetical protein